MATNPPGYMAVYFAQRRARGVCVRCGKHQTPFSRCRFCRQRVKEVIRISITLDSSVVCADSQPHSLMSS